MSWNGECSDCKWTGSTQGLRCALCPMCAGALTVCVIDGVQLRPGPDYDDFEASANYEQTLEQCTRGMRLSIAARPGASGPTKRALLDADAASSTHALGFAPFETGPGCPPWSRDRSLGSMMSRSAKAVAEREAIERDYLHGYGARPDSKRYGWPMPWQWRTRAQQQ